LQDDRLGQATRPLVEELAEIMSASLGWTAAQKQAEIAHTLKVLADYHGVTL
jgi:hypothetical protein